jgi:Ser/Thr protein kinase RdoA (MazF antagonist)
MVESYLKQIFSAIEIMNTAEVCHLDLRPSNVMWRSVSEENVEIRVIDSEDSVVFGEVISPNIY